MNSIYIENGDLGIEMMNKFANEILKKELKNAITMPHYQLGLIGTEFSYKNLFKDSDYYIDKKTSFCHFTSLQVLNAILKNGYLRLSDFSHFADLNELNFGAKVFDNLSLKSEKMNSLIKSQKQNSFALSACISNDDVIRNSFMWQNYGNKHAGAIIEFEINNTNTESLLIGKLQYGVSELKPLKNIYKLAKGFYNQHDFCPQNFPIDIKELLAFHKENKYKEENEARIFINIPKQEHEEHDHFGTYREITKSNEVKCFFRLFLEGRKDVFKNENISNELITDYFDYYPTIKIKRIILGNTLSVEQKLPIVKLFDEFKEQFKYDFNIEYLNNENDLLKWVK